MEPCVEAKGARTAQLPGLLASVRQLKHPSTMHMVIEALQAQDKKGGLSVAAIKQFILTKYPTVDPIRLKHLLKQALSKGLSTGVLVRPRNSTAVGATGSFKLAPRKQQQHKKQQLEQVGADAGEGQAPKLGRKGTTKHPQTGAEQQGAAEEKPTAAKQKLKAKSMNAKPPAAVKPRSNKAKLQQAAGHPKPPSKGHSGPLADEDAGGGDSDGDNPAGARAKGSQKAPVGKNKGKVPKAAQQDVPKAKGGPGKARKPKAGAGAGQKEAGLEKAPQPAVNRKTP